MDSKIHSNTIGVLVLISFRLLFNWGIVLCETMVCAPLWYVHRYMGNNFTAAQIMINLFTFYELGEEGGFAQKPWNLQRCYWDGYF